MLLSVKWMLAPDDSGLLINVKQVLWLLVHAGALQPVEDLTSEDLIRLDLDGEHQRRAVGLQ